MKKSLIIKAFTMVGIVAASIGTVVGISATNLNINYLDYFKNGSNYGTYDTTSTTTVMDGITPENL
jgi:hypothetical protein